jgi:hypothetical protein
MKAMDCHAALEELCRATKKPHMFISRTSSEVVNIQELNKAVPYLDLMGEHAQIWCDGRAFIQFDTDSEMETALFETIGDDGPNGSNTYDGPARWYACTCYGDGQLGSENT